MLIIRLITGGKEIGHGHGSSPSGFALHGFAARCAENTFSFFGANASVRIMICTSLR